MIGSVNENAQLEETITELNKQVSELHSMTINNRNSMAHELMDGIGDISMDNPRGILSPPRHDANGEVIGQSIILSLREDIAKLTSELTQEQENVSEWKNLYVAEKANVAEVKATNWTLENDASLANEQFAQLEIQVEKVDRTVDALHVEISTQKETIATLSNDLDFEKQSTLERETEIARLADIRQDLETRIGELSYANDDLETKLNVAADDIARTTEESSAQLQSAHDKINESLNKNEALKSRTEALESRIQTQSHEQNQQLESWKENIEQKRVHNDQLKHQLEEQVSMFQTEQSTLLGNLETVKADNEQIKEKLETVEDRFVTEHEQLCQAKLDMTRMQRKISNQGTEIQVLESTVESLHESCRKQELYNSEMKTVDKSLRDEIKSLNGRIMNQNENIKTEEQKYFQERTKVVQLEYAVKDFQVSQVRPKCKKE